MIGLLSPLVLFALLVAASAQAQPDSLSLEQAVALGRERAPQMSVQAAAVEAAQSAAVAAGRLPDPELLLGIENVPVAGEDAWSLDRDLMTMRKVGVMQSFPNTRKRASQRDRAAAAVRLAHTQTALTELEVARATASSWIVAYAAQLELESLQSMKPQLELLAESTRATLASARGSTMDALAAQSALAEFDDRLLEARRQVRVARAELARWIGSDAERPLAGAPDLGTLPSPRERVLTSLHKHPELLSYDAQLALARAEVDLARADKRPDWSAQLAYANRGASFADMLSLEFRVALPLFSGVRQDPLVRARRADMNRLQAEREAELRIHEAEVSAALAAWDSAARRIELYEQERLPLARQRTRAALAGFEAGRIELAEVLASQVAEIELQRTRAELIMALGEAWVFLRYLEPEGAVHE